MASSFGGVSAEQQAVIKQRLREHLKEHGILSELKAIVSSTLGDDAENGANADHSALVAARRANVLARIVADSAGLVSAPKDTSERSMLHVLMLGGRAFVNADDIYCGDGNRGSIRVCMQFGEQRFRSQAVPMRAEPALADGVLFELPEPDEAAKAEIAAAKLPQLAMLEQLRFLCRACIPIHVLVLHMTDGKERLLSSCMLEWRQVLDCTANASPSWSLQLI